jgi:pimeloyl-ACP methyl ester carboxylesterase
VDAVEIDGLEIAFALVGTGPPLVLLHGGASDHREWRPQLHGLADAFTVIAWDAPGCGGSSDPPPSFRMADYARVLARLIERLALGRPHVAGLSWGSTLALELWRRRPDLVRSLVLAAPYAGWAGSLPPDELERRLAAALADLERPPDEWIAAFLETLLTEDSSEEARSTLVEIMSASRPAGARPMLLAMAEADLRPVLATIDVPTLLVRGERDVRSSPEAVEAMHDAIPTATLETLAGCAHQANLDRPDAFNEVVRAFLSALP